VNRRTVCMHVLNPALPDARVMREATALAATGFDVTLVDIEHGDRRPAEERVDRVRLKHVRMKQRLARYYSPVSFIPWMLFKVARIVLGALTVVRTRADVYHAHDATALPACYLAARLRRRALVYDVHDIPLVQPHLVRLRAVHAVSAFVIRHMMRRCTGVVTASPLYVDEVQRLFGGPRATVVRNVPVYQEVPPTNRIREYCGLPDDVRIVLYQGGLSYERSLDLLVQAAHYLKPGIVVVMMGDGPSLPSLVEQVARERLEERVKFIPKRPYEELLSWTASADLGYNGISPDSSISTRYALPNKLFEFIMAGLPVLTPQLDACAAIVTQYDVGRVIPSLTPRDIAAAINTILDDPEELARLRSNALSAARRELRWDVESSQIVGLYRRLVPEARQRKGGDSPFDPVQHHSAEEELDVGPGAE
jgi:glycosyltransferase involved in cell wall biosynthesis